MVDIDILAIICQKILLKKEYFRSLVEEISQLKEKADDTIEINDLRLILAKFGCSSANQSLFVKELTAELETEVPYDQLISRVNDCWKKACIKWNLPVQDFQSMAKNDEKAKKTDYVKRVHKALKKNVGKIDIKGLIRKCALFDSAGSNSIKANYLVNVISHNCSGLVAEYELIGLRFELESKTEDQTVDYRAFFNKLDDEEKKQLKAVKK